MNQTYRPPAIASLFLALLLLQLSMKRDREGRLLGRRDEIQPVKRVCKELRLISLAQSAKEKCLTEDKLETAENYFRD